MRFSLLPFPGLFSILVACSSSNEPVNSPAPPDGLVAYGDPVPLEITGPYHILANCGYVSGYDEGIEDPRWVETRLFAVNHLKSQKRPSQFSTDKRIEPQFQANTQYWTNSGYDRGHLAPKWGVDICYGPKAQNETFLLTNVIPQSPALNRGLWETLEKVISGEYAEKHGQVWVICGPVFGPSQATLKEGKVLISERCYKIVLRVNSDGSLDTLSFEMPQNIPWENQRDDLVNYLTTLGQIEKDTHITFFPELPSPVRHKIENQTNQVLW